jgi:Leucine-rich repeat (LRR) protein
VKQIEPLSTLQSLRTLVLSNCESINDIKPLAELVSLKHLYLSSIELHGWDLTVLAPTIKVYVDQIPRLG